jgi:hypothetical protein
LRALRQGAAVSRLIREHRLFRLRTALTLRLLIVRSDAGTRDIAYYLENGSGAQESGVRAVTGDELNHHTCLRS